ncbi:MAG: bacteriohemerythrin [Rhodospirillales bacterium]
MDAVIHSKRRQGPAPTDSPRSVVCCWREALSLGVPVIDQDHRRLIDLLNRLRLTGGGNDNEAAIGAVIVDLETHVQEHFQKEEMLMRLCGYPAYQEHCRMHRALTARVADFGARFRKDPAQFHRDALSEFLVHCVMVHTAREDVKVQPYFDVLGRRQAA